MKTNLIIKSTIAALALAFIPSSPAQTPAADAKDPFATGKGAATAPTAPAPATERPDPALRAANISVCYEAFSLPLNEAGELQRSEKTDGGLYEKLVQHAKLERLLVVRARSGNRSTLNNTTEYRFPTGFSVGQQPADPAQEVADKKDVLKDKKAGPAASSLVLPAGFEQKDLGDALEVEAVFGENMNSIELSFGIQHSAKAGILKWGQGAGEVEQPEFESQKIGSTVSVVTGAPRLLGTLNPPFGEGVSSRAEQRVWFSFITAKVAQ